MLEIIERRKSEGRRKEDEDKIKQIEELKEALAKATSLKGVLPICSYCKSIRDEKGAWKKIEEYLYEHSEARFTHGICPRCMEVFHPDKSATKKSSKGD
jgi:hypothetical protein